MLFNVLVTVACCVFAISTLIVNIAIVTHDQVFIVALQLFVMLSATNSETMLGESLVFLVIHIVFCSQPDNNHRCHSRPAPGETAQTAAKETEAPLLGNEVGMSEVWEKNKDEASEDQKK